MGKLLVMEKEKEKEKEKPQRPTELLQTLPAQIQLYITYLENRLLELEARLNQNSQNSSKPPSADPLDAPPRPPKPTTGNKPGGKKGHPRHQRPLVAVEEVAEIKEWWPSACEKCQLPLRPHDQVGVPSRQQVWEIPKVKAIVTEHQYYQCECPSCGKLNQAKPDGTVPSGQFGPQLSATLAVLHGRYRLTSRELVAVAEGLWDLKLSQASVLLLCHKTSLALAPVYEQALTTLQHSEHSYTDETSWKRQKLRHWLWVGVSKLVTVFYLSQTRGSDGAKHLLGQEYEGVVISDRLRSYGWLLAQRHQWCWAHLLRDFRAISQRGGAGGIWGQEMLEMVSQLFEQWRLYRAGEQSWAEMKEGLGPIRADIHQLLIEGPATQDGAVSSLSGELGKSEASLWVFSEVVGVEPTNNAAERALRPAVIWRKTCFGSQSERGERFVERILTVAASLKQQGRDLIEFVASALKAHWFGEPVPSLLFA